MHEEKRLAEWLKRCLPDDDTEDLGCSGCPFEIGCHGGKTVMVPVEVAEDLRRLLERRKRTQKIPEGMDAREIFDVIESARIQKGMTMTAVSVGAWRDEGTYNHMKRTIAKKSKTGLDTIVRFADVVDVDIVAVRRQEKD